MTSAKELIVQALVGMSDHGNALLSKSVHYIGVASVGTGVSVGLATDTIDRIGNPALWSLPDWAAVVSIAGGISFLIKNAVDTYYKVKNKGRE